MPADATIVTGAAGFVGSHLVERLTGQGPVIGWHRPGHTPPATPPSVRWTPVDITDREAVFAAIEDAQPARIFHLAGAASVGESWRTSGRQLQVNALGTHHLLTAVRHGSRPCRVLVVTSALIYRPSDRPLDEASPLGPTNPYGFSKLAQDQIAGHAAQEEHLDVVIARPFNQIGPRQSPAFAIASFARQLARIEAGLDPPVIRVGNLDTRRDIIDVRDVVSAYELLVAHGRTAGIYNVCAGRAWRIGDLLETMRGEAKVPVDVIQDTGRIRPTDTPVVLGDATRIQREVGWAPVIPLEQSLADMLGWWRQEIAAGRVS